MNPTSLHALIIDRHFGELSAEASELLDLYLAQDAKARLEAERILASLSVTRDAVLQHPELAQVAPVAKVETIRSRRFAVMPWLGRAAAIIVVAGVAAWGGFMAGRSQPQFSEIEVTSVVANAPQSAPRKAAPWARYRMEFDPTGSGMQAVRVDATN